MKKYLLYPLMLLGAFSFNSCSDEDENVPVEQEREWMTMFICDNNRGKGDAYSFNCHAGGENGNDIYLYWYGVKDCAGYQIRQAIQPNVSGGPDAWATTAENGQLLLDTIVGPDVLSLIIKDQQYSTDFRFAIRVLSKEDNNVDDFSHASKWYGHGDGRQWAEYLGIQTADRYTTPFVCYVDQSLTTETTMRVMLNRSWANLKGSYDADQQATIEEKFEIDAEGNFVYQWLVVEPTADNPDATVGSKWIKYRITEEDFERGYIDIDGLSKNSVYSIYVTNENVPIKWDALYNLGSFRSGGEPGEPILIPCDMKAPTLEDFDGSQEAYNTAMEQHQAALQYNATRLDLFLANFITDATLAEGQTFYLEGGKNYVLFNNVTTCKGFVLQTHPDDLAQGKRAKIYMSGLRKVGTNCEAMNFMFGRQPNPGEGGEIYMKMLEFRDIDFECPHRINYGDNQAGVGGVTGNYFINMYSNGMAVHLERFVISNCTFKGLVRGFIREQGSNYKIWDQVIIENNQFFDCGYYSNGNGGYPWIAGSGKNANSNLYKDFQVINNTFYDCPFNGFFSETKVLAWTQGPWNIKFNNNTLVNFNTRGGNIFSMRGIPDGSTYEFKNNLIILTKKDGDERQMKSIGSDIRNTQSMADGTAGHITLDFQNNWSTNTFLTNGQIFSGSLFSATKNSFGTLVNNGSATLTGSLDIAVDDIAPTELMEQPNPPHVAKSDKDQNMHRADALDGSADEFNVNLYYKQTDKVLNSNIWQNNVGDPRWRVKK